MKLSELRSRLNEVNDLIVLEPNNKPVSAHFHITEAGLTTKHFIDCGGTIRKEHYVSFQLWVAEDVDHRLSGRKLEGIINKALPLFEGIDPEVEVEYQQETIGRFGLEWAGGALRLSTKQTDCLAKDVCVPDSLKPKAGLAETIAKQEAACTPGSGCC